MDRQPVRVIVYAWGKSYVDRMLDYAVASLLAPGNLPALVEAFECTLVVVTEEKLFDELLFHPLIRRAKALCTVHLITLDDVIGEPWQYGISLAHALFRGFADLGTAMTKTYLLFLNADFVLATGCYERLIAHIKRGESVLLSPSYCVVEEAVAPLLADMRGEDGVLAIPPRSMASMIIDHRHNTVRAKTINQDNIHFEYMDQVYWHVDANTILGHQMPICMVAMRPEIALAEINTFWDWGVVYEFCPSRRLTVLGDSDEFLILELRSENAHLDLIRSGPITPAAAAARMRRYQTRYQLDNARFPLTLHAKPVPDGIDGPRAQLRGFVDELLNIYRKGPSLSHRDHPQWRYHKEHLARNLEKKKLRQTLDRMRSNFDEECSRLLRIGSSIEPVPDAGLILPDSAQRPLPQPALLREFTAAPLTLRIAADNGTPDPGDGSSIAERKFAQAPRQISVRYERATEALEARLAELERAVLPTIDAFFDHAAALDPEPTRTAGLRDAVRLVARKAVTRMFGSVPRTRPGHPLHLIYRDVSAAFDLALGGERSVLFVGEENGLSCRIASRESSRCFRISVTGLLQSELASAIDEPWCGLSVIELGRDDLQYLDRLRRAVAPHMLPGGRIVMLWVNRECDADEDLRQTLVRAAGFEGDGARVQFVTFARGWGGFDVVSAAPGGLATTKSRRTLALLVALVKLSCHGFFHDPLTTGSFGSDNCLSMTIDTLGAPAGCPTPPAAGRFP